jgi:hypothetical protein
MFFQPARFRCRFRARSLVRPLVVCFATVPLFLSEAGLALPPLPKAELDKIGLRVWHNEAAGKVEGLTDWNVGEHFASLGIGHFIWYPEGTKGPFEESFPGLLAFLRQSGVRLPEWLSAESACPWKDRESFLKEFHGERLKSLRKLLADTVGLQSVYLAQRLEKALPKLLKEAPAPKRPEIEALFLRLSAQPAGRFALIDYVNFKGEGTKASERYAGRGWGLLQVLESMPSQGDVKDFSHAAEKVLRERVQNSPPERKEDRWLPGWLNRARSYRAE